MWYTSLDSSNLPLAFQSKRTGRLRIAQRTCQSSLAVFRCCFCSSLVAFANLINILAIDGRFLLPPHNAQSCSIKPSMLSLPSIRVRMVEAIHWWSDFSIFIFGRGQLTVCVCFCVQRNKLQDFLLKIEWVMKTKLFMSTKIPLSLLVSPIVMVPGCFRSFRSSEHCAGLPGAFALWVS